MKTLARDCLLIAVAIFFLNAYVNTKTERARDGIRQEINALGTKLCERSKASPVRGKYNEALEALVDDYEARRLENQKRGDNAKALINSATIAKLEAAVLPPNTTDCSIPLLPRP